MKNDSTKNKKLFKLKNCIYNKNSFKKRKLKSYFLLRFEETLIIKNCFKPDIDYFLLNQISFHNIFDKFHQTRRVRQNSGDFGSFSEMFRYSNFIMSQFATLSIFNHKYFHFVQSNTDTLTPLLPRNNSSLVYLINKITFTNII